jgi:hypothetical protein
LRLDFPPLFSLWKIKNIFFMENKEYISRPGLSLYERDRHQALCTVALYRFFNFQKCRKSCSLSKFQVAHPRTGAGPRVRTRATPWNPRYGKFLSCSLSFPPPPPPRGGCRSAPDGFHNRDCRRSGAEGGPGSGGRGWSVLGCAWWLHGRGAGAAASRHALVSLH